MRGPLGSGAVWFVMVSPAETGAAIEPLFRMDRFVASLLAMIGVISTGSLPSLVGLLARVLMPGLSSGLGSLLLTLIQPQL